MATTPTEEGVLVSADARYWWKPFARRMTLGAALGVVVSVGMGLDERDWSFVGIPFPAVVVELPLGAIHALLWVRPLRVSYEVDGELLVARRGRRVVRKWRCADVRSINIAEGSGIEWADVLFTNWLLYDPLLPFSSIDVRPKSRWDQHGGEHGIPTIVVWGQANARRANDLLNAALRRTEARESEA